MSTKIYNGLILKNATLEDAVTKLKAIKRASVKSAQDAIRRFCVKKIANNLDLAANVLPISGAPVLATAESLQQSLSSGMIAVLCEGYRSVDWDYSFSISLIPYRGDVLALYYIENDAGYTEVLSQIGFEDFSYQNSTDKPDHISDEEWNSRANVWEEALVGTPAECGVSYEVVSWHDYRFVPSGRLRILENLPTEESRRKYVAVRLIDQEEVILTPNSEVFDRIETIAEKFSSRMTDVILNNFEN